MLGDAIAHDVPAIIETLKAATLAWDVEAAKALLEPALTTWA